MTYVVTVADRSKCTTTKSTHCKHRNDAKTKMHKKSNRKKLQEKNVSQKLSRSKKVQTHKTNAKGKRCDHKNTQNPKQVFKRNPANSLHTGSAEDHQGEPTVLRHKRDDQNKVG